VSEKEGKWAVRLAVSSIGRVEETVRLAVAPHENNIPVELAGSEEIVRMVTVTHYIGIVPLDVFPRYCHIFHCTNLHPFGFSIFLPDQIRQGSFNICSEYSAL
jgi:hypothetical protein